MTTHVDRPSNPFSTRFVRPGAISYHCTSSQNAAELANRLADLSWRAQIIGPHGTGKTTLLHTLAPHLRAAGRTLAWFTLHGGQRRLPSFVQPSAPPFRSVDEHRPPQIGPGVPVSRPPGTSLPWNRDTLVIVDGYEQLDIPGRIWLRLRCRFFGTGLLVTSHQDARLPTLVQTEPRLDTFRCLVRKLTDGDVTWIEPPDLLACYRRAGGNIRDAFFDLYDQYEQARPQT